MPDVDHQGRMKAIFESVQDAAAFVRSKNCPSPVVGMILGTGLGGVSEQIELRSQIPFQNIPHFPCTTVEGHTGNLLLGEMGGCNVVATQGRFHYYEGHSLQRVTLPVRVMKELGVKVLLISSAAGGLNPLFVPGDVMIVTDHINLMGHNPLRGVIDPRLGDRFPDMSQPYDSELIYRAEKVAQNLRIRIRLGVYAAVSGPSLETPAETRMLQFLGADAVGMSTVPEVIVGRQIGLRILALTAITNVNLPDCMAPIDIDRVIGNAMIAGPKIGSILNGVIQAQISGLS